MARVVLIEDEPNIAEAIRFILSRDGWDVTALADGLGGIEAIRAGKDGRTMEPAADLYPRAEDGLRSMAAVFAVAESGKQMGAWMDARPPMFR